MSVQELICVFLGLLILFIGVSNLYLSRSLKEIETHIVTARRNQDLIYIHTLQVSCIALRIYLDVLKEDYEIAIEEEEYELAQRLHKVIENNQDSLSALKSEISRMTEDENYSTFRRSSGEAPNQA